MARLTGANVTAAHTEAAKLGRVRPVAIRPFKESEARAVAEWTYEPPFDIYNGDPSRFEDYLAIDDRGYGFYALANRAEEIIGSCCFGDEARVTGQVPIEGVVDLGGGVRPDLVSHGIATDVFPAIVTFAISTFRPMQLRTAIASFNERSTRLCLSAGFSVTRVFDGPGRQFQELLRTA
ncbi:MAG: GNAT family N-acetyltransferase [Ilumatobacteraceae bacterium]|nr:GNAT family N-acetyltransferase [Acidimicrobiales bacterium]